eukprot:TRINITY_DN39713_c0_g1_i1.p1 TRINITY_DN39713_c0_g1~~TRINITY_DN39713_c0_g1_i1.p1  ORF type:complete len:632 (+),score=205.32 TRINITY_DN39713_c0_g1_i1:112-1896(+)
MPVSSDARKSAGPPPAPSRAASQTRPVGRAVAAARHGPPASAKAGRGAAVAAELQRTTEELQQLRARLASQEECIAQQKQEALSRQQSAEEEAAGAREDALAKAQEAAEAKHALREVMRQKVEEAEDGRRASEVAAQKTCMLLGQLSEARAQLIRSQDDAIAQRERADAAEAESRRLRREQKQVSDQMAALQLQAEEERAARATDAGEDAEPSPPQVLTDELAALREENENMRQETAALRRDAEKARGEQRAAEQRAERAEEQQVAERSRADDAARELASSARECNNALKIQNEAQRKQEQAELELAHLKGQQASYYRMQDDLRKATYELESLRRSSTEFKEKALKREQDYRILQCKVADMKIAAADEAASREVEKRHLVHQVQTLEEAAKRAQAAAERVEGEKRALIEATAEEREQKKRSSAVKRSAAWILWASTSTGRRWAVWAAWQTRASRKFALRRSASWTQRGLQETEAGARSRLEYSYVCGAQLILRLQPEQRAEEAERRALAAEAEARGARESAATWEKEARVRELAQLRGVVDSEGGVRKVIAAAEAEQRVLCSSSRQEQHELVERCQLLGECATVLHPAGWGIED